MTFPIALGFVFQAVFFCQSRKCPQNKMQGYLIHYTAKNPFHWFYCLVFLLRFSSRQEQDRCDFFLEQFLHKYSYISLWKKVTAARSAFVMSKETVIPAECPPSLNINTFNFNRNEDLSHLQFRQLLDREWIGITIARSKKMLLPLAKFYATIGQEKTGK